MLFTGTESCSMKDLPDVAASLFTNDYRDMKLKGRRPRQKGPGTGSVRTKNNLEFLRLSMSRRE